MALCTSCGSKVDDAASFCTSCGQRMPSSNGATATVTVTRPTCSACGAQVDLGSVFCTNCGQQMAAQPAVIEDTAPAPSQAPPIAASTAPPLAVDAATVPPPLPVTSPEDAAVQPAAPQIAPPVFATPADYSPEQPGGGAFRAVVIILLLVIVVGALGGWYFWGVETVIVCSPPDVRVFLDDKELQPLSYGRYVVPHLSRQSHLLKVQRPGFADTIQKLDFPLTSTQEWVNIKLVPSRQVDRRQ
ncbi:MAG TPA: zinc-ribbon domain-containing protein [Candidatus Angelobacter sp.]|nr:zinc-ribbon domain-containing protein [Candidatus Angelobacter sp.]